MLTKKGTAPRFGMLAPSLKSSTLTPPYDLINSLTASKSIVLESDDDLLSHRYCFKSSLQCDRDNCRGYLNLSTFTEF